MFRKGDFLLKQKGRTRQPSRFFPAIGSGVLIFAGFTFLFAYFIHSDYATAAWTQPVRMAALSTAALMAGKVTGGTGKKGLLIGAILALIWLVWKVCVNINTVITANTLCEIALCILFSWAGSCIFHKNKHGYTKRNHNRSASR